MTTPVVPPRSHASVAWPVALAFAALIVYASLFPFTGWRSQGLAPWAFLTAPLPRYWTRFDVGTNLVGYLPLGFLLALAGLHKRPAWLALGGASLAAVTLSFGMEALQTYLPTRVSSNVDFALNSAGGLLGALLAWLPHRLGWLAHWQRARVRWFAPHTRGALALLALWPWALLYPAPVPFGLGQVFERAEAAVGALLQGTPFLDWLPIRETELQPLLPGVELLCVALGLLIPCLLAFSATRALGRRLLLMVAVGALGVGATALSAALSWGPANAWRWINLPVRWGLYSAAALALLAALPPRRVVAVLLLLVLPTHLALLNQAPTSAYFASTLESWERGRFIHFYGVGQWLGRLRPYATLAYTAVSLARREPREPRKARAPALGPAPTIDA